MQLPKYKILVVDDDLAIISFIRMVLEDSYDVCSASSCNEAIDIARHQEFQIVLLDLGSPDGDGSDLLKHFKEINEDIEVIIVTMHQDEARAVAAIRMGAFDYIDKNFEPEGLKNLVGNALVKYLRRKKILSLETQIEQMISDGFIVGCNPKMHKVYHMVEKAAGVPATVLITGESGTGKEIIARRIHYLSENQKAPFIALNVAAVPSDLIESTLFGHERGAFTGAQRMHYGKFELADTGTLFLDEIGDLRLDLQAKFLRVLQDQVIERVGGNKAIPVNVRIIAATNVDLESKIREGKFREDLFYRLNVLRIHLPPLRERLEDIPELVRFFIKKYNQKFKRNVQDISDLVLSVLCSYHWPGNIRELENLVERLIVLSEKSVITEGDIPVEYLVHDFDALKKHAPDGDVLAKASETFERCFILKVLEKEEWNQTKAAQRLGIHRKTLEYKIKKYDISAIITQKRPSTIFMRE